MKILLRYLIILLLPGLWSCEQNPDNPSPDGPFPFPLSQKSQVLVQSGNDFSFDFFREVLLSAETGKNVMVSPLSASLALAMTYNGAAGDTRTAMEEALRMQGLSPEEINQAYAEIMQGLLGLDPKVILEIANSIWYRNTVPVNPDFISTNEQYYQAEVAALDFNDPASVVQINNWVSDHTHGKIYPILDQINPLDIMYLINAIYFKGSWTYRFDQANTEERVFTPAGEAEKMVPTMYMESDVEYFSDNLARGIRLPYGAGNFGMMILLPAGENSPEDLAESMTPGVWDSWLESMDTVPDMKIYLPKFKYSYKRILNPILTTMGMGIAFDPLAADFSGINPDIDLYISSVLQKTFIEVNEQGTEAAAVTIVTVGTTSVEPTNEFRADRPFLYVIYEKVTGAILFMGKVADPELDE